MVSIGIPISWPIQQNSPFNIVIQTVFIIYSVNKIIVCYILICYVSFEEVN